MGTASFFCTGKAWAKKDIVDSGIKLLDNRIFLLDFQKVMAVLIFIKSIVNFK